MAEPEEVGVPGGGGDIEARVMAAAMRVFPNRRAALGFLRIRSPRLGGLSPDELVKAGRGAEVLAFLTELHNEAPASQKGPFDGWLGRFGRR